VVQSSSQKNADAHPSPASFLSVSIRVHPRPSASIRGSTFFSINRRRPPLAVSFLSVFIRVHPWFNPLLKKPQTPTPHRFILICVHPRPSVVQSSSQTTADAHPSPASFLSVSIRVHPWFNLLINKPQTPTPRPLHSYLCPSASIRGSTFFSINRRRPPLAGFILICVHPRPSVVQPSSQ